MTDAPSPITIAQRDHIHIITFMRNIFSEEMIHQVQEQLRELITQTDTPHVVLDMSHVNHASSNFLGLMMDVTLKVGHKQGQTRVCHMTPDVKEMFALTHLDRMVPIHDTLESAIASFK